MVLTAWKALVDLRSRRRSQYRVQVGKNCPENKAAKKIKDFSQGSKRTLPLIFPKETVRRFSSVANLLQRDRLLQYIQKSLPLLHSVFSHFGKTFR